MHNSIIALAISVFLLSSSGTITEHSEVKTVEQSTSGQSLKLNETAKAQYVKKTLEKLEKSRESSNRYYANWEPGMDFGDPCRIVIDEETALAIGNAIMGDPIQDGYQTVTVVYDPSPDFFVVYRCIATPDDVDVFGGDYTVIISKKDGAILGYWGGE